MPVTRLLRIVTISLVVALCPAVQAQTNPESAAAAAEKSAVAAAKSAAAAAASAETALTNTWAPPNTLLLYLVPFVAFFGSLIAIVAIRGALKPTSWSLAESLSEEVPVPVYKETTDPNGVKTRELVYDKEGKPVLIPELKASTSRVIALMGLVAILFLFIGFGVFALFSFGSVGRLPPSMSEVVKFLVAGLTLFAPYFVNKFASLFQGIAGGK